LNAGDPADDGDTWLRPVTNSKHLRRGGGVHHAAFKKWLEPPDDPQAGWKLEVSGQLLSLIDNIVDEAQKRVTDQQEKFRAKGERVPSVLQFCGVLCENVARIGSLPLLNCDVIFDPKPKDFAHANLVVRDKGLDEILTVIDALLTSLTWVPKDQIADVALLRRNASGKGACCT
jgi:hypothetical protein